MKAVQYVSLNQAIKNSKGNSGTLLQDMNHEKGLKSKVTKHMLLKTS